MCFFPQLCISLMNVDVIPYNFSVCASAVCLYALRLRWWLGYSSKSGGGTREMPIGVHHRAL